MRERLLCRMRDGESNVAGPKLLRECESLAVELDGGPLPRWSHHFDIAPPDALVPSCAQRFHARFLCCEARGIAFETSDILSLAVLNLALGIDAVEKAVAEA